MRKIELIVRKFLSERGYLEKSLLLALSGGPDSMALFHALLKIRVRFEVAHVDHSWRHSSGEEAENLRLMCEEKEIPFHLTKLSIAKNNANLEELCRKERLVYFHSILTLTGCAAVLTAHHADDQAETVLKRTLEGASLNKLSALLPEKKMALGMTVLRPLLSLSKGEILEWLAIHQIPYIKDSSNQDLRFLRARMRENILPTLSLHFGKNVQKGLCHLANRALEFDQFLNERLNPILSTIQKEEEGRFSLLFPEECLQSPFLLEEALKRFLNFFEISISNSLLKRYVEYLQKSHKIKVENYRGSRVEFTRGKVTLLIDKAR